MPIWSLLLRAFLSLVLILNGMGTAAASVHLPGFTMVASTEAAAPSTLADAGELPCHQQQGEAASAGAGYPSADPPRDSADHQQPDCCKSGLCRCECMHSAHAAVMAWAITTPFIEHGIVVRSLPLGHAAPALPHLIRPPIG